MVGSPGARPSAGARPLALDDADCASETLPRMGSIGWVRSFSAQLLDKVVAAVTRDAEDVIEPSCLRGGELVGEGSFALVQKAW